MRFLVPFLSQKHTQIGITHSLRPWHSLHEPCTNMVLWGSFGECELCPFYMGIRGIFGQLWHSSEIYIRRKVVEWVCSEIRSLYKQGSTWQQHDFSEDLWGWNVPLFHWNKCLGNPEVNWLQSCTVVQAPGNHMTSLYWICALLTCLFGSPMLPASFKKIYI